MLHCSIAGKESQMFANVMSFIDRTAMSFIILLGAAPMLAIAAAQI